MDKIKKLLEQAIELIDQAQIVATTEMPAAVDVLTPAVDACKKVIEEIDRG